VCPPTRVTISPFIVITYDFPITRETKKATDKNNTLVIKKIIKTIVRTIVTIAHLELSLVIFLEQEPE
jgi:hypothetical protein